MSELPERGQREDAGGAVVERQTAYGTRSFSSSNQTSMSGRSPQTMKNRRFRDPDTPAEGPKCLD